MFFFGLQTVHIKFKITWNEMQFTLGIRQVEECPVFFVQVFVCLYQLLYLCASENVGRLVTPAKKLEDTLRLAELVIEVLQQNEEHHAEVSVPDITW